MKEQEKILIISDETLIEENFLASFEGKNYQLDFSYNTNSAISKIEHQCYALFLIDIRLLFDYEREFIKRLKGVGKDKVLLLMTNPEFKLAAIDLLKQGFYDYVTTPFNGDELQHIIENALQWRSLLLENEMLKKKVEELDQLFEINNSTEDVSLASIEKIYILRMLNKNNWNISRSASLLKIDRVTLYNKINKYNLRTTVEA